MSKVWIKVPITLHLPGKNFGPRVEAIGDFLIQHGNTEVVVIPSNTPVEIDSDEAERLIARFGGQYCEKPK